MVPIECVSVCVGYGDLLEQVAQFNRPLLARWLIVTEAADERTRSVCRRFSIECLTTEEKKRDGEFSKGRLIDRGIAMLSGNGWVLHLDADIALPADMHQVLDDAHLDERCIYGCDRLNVTTRQVWEMVRQRPFLCRENGWAVHLQRQQTTVGARVANEGYGYTPLGFMQLWSGQASIWQNWHTRRYPYHHGTAARTDVQHALQWDRRQRVLIPELLVLHLESEPSPMGLNWRGRKSAPFDAPASPKRGMAIQPGGHHHPHPPRPYE